MSALAIAAPARHTLFEWIDDTVTILDTIDGLDEADDEAREDLERRLAFTLHGTREKVDRTAGVLGSLEVAAAAAKAEAARCSARAKRFESQIAQIESRVLAIMAANGLKRLEGNVSTLSSRACPVSVVIDRLEAIPYEYLRSPAIPADVPDKRAIGDAWKKGIAVAGTHIAASERLVRS